MDIIRVDFKSSLKAHQLSFNPSRGRLSRTKVLPQATNWEPARSAGTWQYVVLQCFREPVLFIKKFCFRANILKSRYNVEVNSNNSGIEKPSEENTAKTSLLKGGLTCNQAPPSLKANLYLPPQSSLFRSATSCICISRYRQPKAWD
ncbi:hypothetical protein CDAR_533741 [Caerostris darwini]|uniref:Uncharacterized protein n=1 Tax=Caerostris darwini TaxID=1538125 RepID=A0AAV4S4I8_9ARAC|nr:hypothetical protein CDAR_533741 [Caerostris darwini]